MPLRLRRTASSSDWIKNNILSASLPSGPTKDCIPWIEKYAPKTESDLVIHREKIRELKNILLDVFLDTSNSLSGGPILVLSGPSGSGKTSTLCALSKGSLPEKLSKSVRLIEFSDESLDSDDFAHLEQFICLSGRYGCEILNPESSDPSNSVTIILIKYFPVSIVDQLHRFHDILRHHRNRAQPTCLLVLVFSTNSSSNEGVLSERVLCPPSLRNELNIRRIDFNPVAPSLVLKALSRITASHMFSGSNIGMPPRALLQQLSSECGGDLRTAINHLQFLAKSGWTAVDTHPDCRRDVGLVIFRALGKIFYNKREPGSTKSIQLDSEFPTPPLPPHLSHWRRDSLSFEVDDILDQCGMNGDNVISWLYENFLDFTPSMTAAQWSSDRFSWADAYLSGGMNWRLGLTAAAAWNECSGAANTTSAASRHYAAITVVRSLLLAHDLTDNLSSPESTSFNRQKQFHQFKPPSKQDAWKFASLLADELKDFCLNSRNRIRSDATKHLISGRHRMLIDLLPYLLQLPTDGVDNADVDSLVSLCCGFGRSQARCNNPPPVKQSKLQPDRVEETWMCPMDAVSEGNELPIEEDLSDDTQSG